jgi:hypothetical protein
VHRRQPPHRQLLHLQLLRQHLQPLRLLLPHLQLLLLRLQAEKYIT